MYQDKVVLCGANSYEEKYYLNPDFDRLPDHVKDELKIMCVLYVNDVGGILDIPSMAITIGGTLGVMMISFPAGAFKKIGSHLKIKQIQREKQDLLEALQLYYRVFFLGEEIE